VIGAPMYNFSIPSTLKAWIDRVAVAGKTFRYTAQGPQGLVKGKRVFLAITQGGVHELGGASEHHESYLRFVLGFLGITEVEVVRAQGLAMSAEHRAHKHPGGLARGRRPQPESEACAYT
ncbi:MAG: NAD(P)H-dependent oxidoreductase, partial [Rhodanobacteraceae bacterium]|nr:NAD(P)H-dependent oxidoreductase [Rhodanobacteraceae bacterium]